MKTREISFTIQGMRDACIHCAITIERALTRLDGVIAANVNYAAERAIVVYDPRRVSGRMLVSVVRSEGFDVPLQRITIHVDDLLYATSPRIIENVLGRVEGVADVELDLRDEQITVDTFGKPATLSGFARVLGRLGFHTRATPGSHHAWGFVLRTFLVALLALIVIVSASEHAGWIPETSVLHVPFIAIVISFFALIGAGLPFYRVAGDAFLQSEFDAGILIALVSAASFLIGVPLALVAPTAWLTGIAFVVATTLLAGWFSARGFTVFVLPRIQRAHTKAMSLSAQPQLGVISHGTRH